MGGGRPGFVDRLDRDGDGQPYLELTVPTTGSSKHFDECGHLYTVLDGRLLKSRTCYRGEFQVRTHPGALLGARRHTDRPALVLGDSPRADTLRALEIEPEPFQVRYCPSMNSCFDLPLEP